MFRNKWIMKAVMVAGLGAGVVGCESHAGNDALIGGAAGAGIGALIGSVSHARAGEGALIGGAIGAIGGGLIGNEQDRREHYRERAYYDDRRPAYYEDRYYYEERPVVRERRVYRVQEDCPPAYGYRR